MRDRSRILNEVPFDTVIDQVVKVVGHANSRENCARPVGPDAAGDLVSTRFVGRLAGR